MRNRLERIRGLLNVFLPVDQMCDRAHMALNTVKGRYMTRFAYYDENMRELILE